MALKTELVWNIFILGLCYIGKRLWWTGRYFCSTVLPVKLGKVCVLGLGHPWLEETSCGSPVQFGRSCWSRGKGRWEAWRGGGSHGGARQGKCASCWRKEKMKGKRRVKNKAEMSRKGGEGRQELMVLKLDGEWGQGELIWCSPLGQNSHWSCCQTWPGQRGELESRLESKGKGRGEGVPAVLQHPSCSGRISLAPRGASLAALGTHQPV